LGASSRAYVVRADIDLSQLVGNSVQPTGTPVSGTVWLDTSDSKFGINVWSTTTNNGQGGFTFVTPDVIDGTDYTAHFSSGLPLSSYGMVGDYVMVTPSSSINTVVPSGLYYKSATNGWVAVSKNFDGGKTLQISPHYSYPNFNTSTASGSVWVCTTPISNGSSWDYKYYNGNTARWTSVNAPLYADRAAAIAALDDVTGGLDIPLGSVFIDSDFNNNGTATFKQWIRGSSGPTTISVTSSTVFNAASSFQIRESLSTGSWNSAVSVNVTPSTTIALGQQIASAINTNSNFVNVSATWNASTNNLTIRHALGGEIEFKDLTNTPLTRIGISSSAVGSIANLYSAPTGDGGYTLEASNWKPLTFTSQMTAPGLSPLDGTLWFNSYLGDVDIMYNDGTKWQGYRNAFPLTDPMGPIISSSMPDTQSNGVASLQNGDIWIDASMPDEYGQNVYVYNLASGGWILQDVSDHHSPNGWVFGDARWSDNGVDNPEYNTSIVELLNSNYLDPDAPNYALYPKGTRLWNTRRSSNNVKQYIQNYINTSATNPNAGNESMSGYSADRWVSASPNDAKGRGAFGRKSQRAIVTKSLMGLVTANTAVRDTDTLAYNLIACPGYPELIQDMVNLNSDIGQLALVVGDTPFRLKSDATSLTNYGNNTAKALENDDTALVTHDTYTAVYYPSGYTNDNYGNRIVVPPSHMLLHTIINSDNVSYPWFAPAGTNRGVITNANSVGYVDSDNGQFVPASLYNSLRDVLSTVQINPIATLPGSGLTVMGQYTRDGNSTALNRINVARLVSYIRRQLTALSKPFLFEPNDTQTRNEIKSVIEGLMLELVSQRGLNDYVVVCDSTNNTPTRIDRNELWVDIAIEPVKAVEFIYIPLRLLNTGAIASGNFGSSLKGSNNNSTGQ
jgi:hypothetical protein